jgi:hypothetical protein
MMMMMTTTTTTIHVQYSWFCIHLQNENIFLYLCLWFTCGLFSFWFACKVGCTLIVLKWGLTKLPLVTLGPDDWNQSKTASYLETTYFTAIHKSNEFRFNILISWLGDTTLLTRLHNT